MTDRQLERLRILACPDSYVSSLCDPDRAAVRAAVEEIEQSRAEVARLRAAADQFLEDLCAERKKASAEIQSLRAALASIQEMAGRNAGPPSRPIISGLETIFRAIEADARSALEPASR